MTNPKRFLSEEEHRENTRVQLEHVPITLGELKAHGVTDNSALQLEYFFFTDSPLKATGLMIELKERGYEIEHGRSDESEDVYIITGWTDKLPMSEASIVQWCNEMCELGYQFDCEFDGWGTYPE